MAAQGHLHIKLADELPELVGYISAGLTKLGRPELISGINAAEVHDVFVRTHGAGIDLVPNLDETQMMFHPDRERIGIGSPGGVRRRQWAISLEVIQGRIWAVNIAHPGS
jgi:uncharacterized NAD-dependent epimerase/dehydratase family protein